MRRGFVATDGGQVHYRRWGERGPAVLLLHQAGSGHSSRSWLRLGPLLAAAGRDAIAIDTPGYGDSTPAPHPCNAGQYAAVFIAVADALGIAQFSVAGDHTGAVLAVAVAAAYPARVSGMVLNGLPLWDAATRAAMATRAAAAATAEERLKPDGSHLLDLWQRTRERYPDLPLTDVQLIVLDALACPDPAASHPALWHFDVAAHLPGLQCPLIVVAAEHDPLAQYCEAAARLAPAGRSVIVPGQRGMLPLQAPDVLADLIEQLFANPPRPVDSVPEAGG